MFERRGPLTPDMIARIVERAAKSANLGFQCPAAHAAARHGACSRFGNDDPRARDGGGLCRALALCHRSAEAGTICIGMATVGFRLRLASADGHSYRRRPA